MKYQVDQDKLAHFIASRPAMIRHVTTLTEAFILKIFQGIRGKAVVALYDLLPIEFKTMDVTRKYIDKAASYYFDYSLIPRAIEDQLTKNDRLNLIEKGVHNIEEMYNVTSEEWQFAIEHNYTNFDNIPRELWTKDLVLMVVSKPTSDYVLSFFKDLPLWDEEFAERIVSQKSEALEIVPPHLISNKVLRQGCDQNLKGIQIPTSSWDLYTAAAAVEACSDNIKCIPSHLITREMINRSAMDGMWDELPSGKDYEAFVHYMAGNNNSASYQTPDKSTLKWAKRVNPQKFIPETVALGCTPYTLTRYGFTLTEELWVKILTIKPEFLADVPKSEQTDEMIEAFFAHADHLLMDRLKDSINLGRIKAYHAPLLVNCESELLVEIRNKFLKGDEMDAGANEVEINISPSQFAKIRYYLK